MADEICLHDKRRCEKPCGLFIRVYCMLPFEVYQFICSQESSFTTLNYYFAWDRRAYQGTKIQIYRVELCPWMWVRVMESNHAEF